MAKPTVRFGRDDLRFSAADEAHAPLTVMVKKIAAATGLFEPMALWALSDRDVARLRAECERNDDEVGMMMVDVHRNMRRALSPAEAADARGVVVTLLTQARERQRKLGKAAVFDAARHPRFPKGDARGGQFVPKSGARVTAERSTLEERQGRPAQGRPQQVAMDALAPETPQTSLDVFSGEERQMMGREGFRRPQAAEPTASTSPRLPEPTPMPEGATLADMGLRTSTSRWSYLHSDAEGAVFRRSDGKQTIRHTPEELKALQRGERIELDFGPTARGHFQADWSGFEERRMKEVR